MRPELWGLLGLVLSSGVAYVTARLGFRAQSAKTAVDKEVGAGQLALDVAREAKAESASAKLEASNARREAGVAHQQSAAAQRALHETRLWYITEHMPWDQAVMEVILRLDPEAAQRLPPRKEPPLWDRPA